MSLTVQRTGPPLTSLRFTNRELMRQIGLAAREMIVRHTLAGVDATGASFAPYSANYATRKQAYTQTAAGVNLTVSGNMLRDLQIVDVTDDSVTLGWLK